MVANLSSVNPHGVLAARRLLHGCVFLGADTLAEQALILLPLIDKPAVIAAANAALASVPWNKMAVRAVRIVAEVRLLKRISNMNSRGVTPSSRMVAEMLVQEWPIHVPQPSVTQWLAKLPHELAVRRRWLVKFRRFWGVRFRQLGSRGHLSPVDQRRKVSSKKKLFPVHFFEQVLTPTSGYKIIGLWISPEEQKLCSRTRIWAPKLSPSCGVKNLVQHYHRNLRGRTDVAVV